MILPPNFAKYRAVSQQIGAIFRSVTALVEPLSLDEAYLDVTENAWSEPLGVDVARRIKLMIQESTSLTASAGVAPNKFLAKIASGWRKPDGLTVIAPERVETFLQTLPVEALWGVGPVTARRLREHGITKLVDVRGTDPERLRSAVGDRVDSLIELAHGRDDRPVEPDRASKSCSSECTYTHDLTDLDRMRDEIDRMARENAAWLNRKRLLARTVTIKVRYADFTTLTRSDTRAATADGDEIAGRATELLGKTDAGRRSVRLLGAGVHNFVSPDEDREEGRLPLESASEDAVT